MIGTNRKPMQLPKLVMVIVYLVYAD